MPVTFYPLGEGDFTRWGTDPTEWFIPRIL